MNPQLSTKTSATRDERRVVVPFKTTSLWQKLRNACSFVHWWFKKHVFEKTNPFPSSIYGLFLKITPKTKPISNPKRTQFSRFYPPVFQASSIWYPATKQPAGYLLPGLTAGIFARSGGSLVGSNASTF